VSGIFSISKVEYHHEEALWRLLIFDTMRDLKMAGRRALVLTRGTTTAPIREESTPCQHENPPTFIKNEWELVHYLLKWGRRHSSCRPTHSKGSFECY